MNNQKQILKDMLKVGIPKNSYNLWYLKKEPRESKMIVPLQHGSRRTTEKMYYI
jgi:hypothetical protein